MSNPAGRRPLDPLPELRELVRETGVPEGEVEDLAATLVDLAAWSVPSPTADETRQLVERLRTFAPVLSPVRQALRPRSPTVWSELDQLLGLVRSQVSILRPTFWLITALVAFVGALVLLAGPNLSQVLVLQLVGPILSYLGTASAFRSSRLHVLEFELACPPSARQLTLARLTIILSYDLALGLLLTGASWSQSGAAVATLTLHWLAPLLLGVGLTLVLSLRLRIDRAAAIAYTGWLALLAGELVGENGGSVSFTFVSAATEEALTILGIGLIAGAVIALPRTLSRMLSQP